MADHKKYYIVQGWWEPYPNDLGEGNWHELDCYDNIEDAKKRMMGPINGFREGFMQYRLVERIVAESIV